MHLAPSTHAPRPASAQKATPIRAISVNCYGTAFLHRYTLYDLYFYKKQANKLPVNLVVVIKVRILFIIIITLQDEKITKIIFLLFEN